MKTTIFRTWVSALFFSLFWAGLTSNTIAAGYTLTLGALGSGTVTPDNSNNPHPPGVVITITAAADPGWYFANWSGDTNGSVNPLQVTMNSNLSITGNFLALPAYTLTLATNGQGRIDLNPSGGSYLSNSIVTVTATPAVGWVFTSWSGSTNVSVNPLSITMDANNSLTGTFAQLPAFDTEPQNITNATGSTVSFTSHAAGNLPLGYQWFFSGGSLANATNTTLTLTNIQLANAGNYWIIATNSCGSATSSVVALVITNSIGTTNVVNSPDEASLRAAIKIGGWVSIGCNGTITITNTISITNNVILDAQGVSATISGGNAVRLFYVAPDAALMVTNLTLANGACIVTNGPLGTNADAGAIYNNGGTVTLVACTLTNNNAQCLLWSAVARGGAIFNNGGTLSLCQSAISNNAVIAGGLNNINYQLALTNWGLGGAIFSTNGSLTIVGCNVSGNLCEAMTDYGGVSTMTTGRAMGGAVFQGSGSSTIISSIFALNQAFGGRGASVEPSSSAYGGAVAANGGSLTIDRSQFLANTAQGGNAGSHGAGGPAFGGAVYSVATLTIRDSSFFGNQSFAGGGTVVPTAASKGTDAFGGAVYNSGTAVLNRCSICSNYTQGGSATAYMGFSGNGGNGLGGGIFNASQFTATDCTIALNVIVGGNGSQNQTLSIGTNGAAIGGGIFNYTSATFIAMNLTVANNICSSPPGSSQFGFTATTNGIAAGTQIANTNGTLRLHNALIAYGGTNGNSFGVITDDGYNICSDGTANLNSGKSYNNTDPKLLPLDYYTGPTLCMALPADSPAIDFGDSSGAPPTDQRGYPRPNGDGVDMGAYEFYPPNQFVMPQLNLSSCANSVTVSVTAFPSTNTFCLIASTNLLSWNDWKTNGPFATVTNINQTICGPIPPVQYFRLRLQ